MAFIGLLKTQREYASGGMMFMPKIAFTCHAHLQLRCYMYSLSHSTRHLSIAAADLSPTPSGNTLFAIAMATSALYLPFFSCSGL
jgi:hypothetical protein